MSDLIDARVADSVAFLREHLSSLRGRAPASSALLDHAYRGLSASALGGKHLRARLVHISAGRVDGEKLHAAVVFGACVDLIHGAFLIHDDIIDRDDLRRSTPTVHATVRDEFNDEHLGLSVAIPTGDLGLITATEMLLNTSLNDRLVRQALGILSATAEKTIVGEILDVAHTVTEEKDPEFVRLSNHLKTSEYSFSSPLKLGALAAGRDPSPMDVIGRELGQAYQAADDIAGVMGSSSHTGKTVGGDVTHGRSTLMTMQMADGDEEDPKRILAIATNVAKEGQSHLDAARAHITTATLEPEIKHDLISVIVRIEKMLREHT